MGIHLVVDGYNLIRRSPVLSRQEAISLERGRAALAERLSAYKSIKRWPVTVVFDAAGGPERFEKKERYKGIEMIFSAIGETADQVIIGMARKRGEKILVVTSDRALAAAVERFGGMVIEAAEFEDKMEMAFYQDIKGEVDEDEDNRPTLSTRKRGPVKRKSRSERRKERRLKKI